MGEQTGRKEQKEQPGRRWTASDARQMLDAWQSSGQSLNAFSAEHGVKPERLSWWKARLHDWSANATAKVERPARLVPAVVRPGGTEAEAVVRFPSGVAVEVMDTASVSPQWLAVVAAELARR